MLCNVHCAQEHITTQPPVTMTAANLEETKMENTNTTSAAGINKIRHFDRISESLNKAKAITTLMAYAVAEGSFSFGEEVIWAQQVVSGLIDDAMESAEILADQKRGNEDDAPGPDIA